MSTNRRICSRLKQLSRCESRPIALGIEDDDDDDDDGDDDDDDDDGDDDDDDDDDDNDDAVIRSPQNGRTLPFQVRPVSLTKSS